MSEGRRRRVPVEQSGGESGGRAGCLVLGAVLGILAGIAFALYGLPPLLNALYGATVVPAGERAEVGDLRLQVESYTVGEDLLCRGTPACPSASIQVTVFVAAEKAWAPEPGDILVEVEGIRTWLGAIAPVAGVSLTELSWGPGEERVVVLRFPLPLGASPEETVPLAVHVTDPRVELELSGELRR